MKTYHERTPFGQEQRLNLGFGATCPVCNVQRGVHHKYGCQAEECPKCHGPLLGCFCECIHPAEEFRIVRAIKASFTSLDEAARAGAGVGNRNLETMTPVDKAAVAYFLNNCPPETKAEIDKDFHALFPDLESCGTNENGERMYRADDIAGAIGMDQGEVHEVCRSMVEDDRDAVPLPSAAQFN